MKQSLTTDDEVDGYPTITIYHHEPKAQVSLKGPKTLRTLRITPFKTYSVGPCVEIWAPLCFFLVKVILIDFQLEKYMQCKAKMFTIFSCSINVTVTSQNGVPSFHLHQRAYMWWGYLHT